MGLRSTFHALVSPTVLAAWAVVVAATLAVLWSDIRTRNEGLPSLMKLVWTLTVLYSGPLGLAVYWYAGRTQIPTDDIWRRGFRSVAHCYSGCGMGEVVGITLLAGLLAASTLVVVAGTFAFAFFFGYSLTVGPLLQDGVGVGEAVADAFYSETASIAVMEAVAIGVDVFLAGEATMGAAVFWASLLVSLTLGLLAAYPVNLLLIHVGVKEGMGNPAEM